MESTASLSDKRFRRYSRETRHKHVYEHAGVSQKTYFLVNTEETACWRVSRLISFDSLTRFTQGNTIPVCTSLSFQQNVSQIGWQVTKNVGFP